MANVNSSSFTINVNRSTAGELGTNGRVQSTIVVYKGSQRLSPVSSTPTTGQFKVTISSQDGCSASIKENDTVYVNSMSSTNATITLNINVENAVNFQKNINLVKSISNEEISNIESRVSVAEQKITEDAITNVVSKKFYTKDQTNTQISSKVSTVQQTVDSWGVRISQNETDISSLKLTDEQFSVKIGGKADKSNIISMINASTEGITISSSKVNISGFVTFSDLSTSGRTTINGGNITTGYISGNRIKGGIITATEEINFEGGARIFGTTGDYGAGLTISAGGFSFSGGTTNFLGGNWYMSDGNLTIEKGNLTIEKGGLTCNGIIGTSLSVNGASSLNGNMSNTGTAWLTTVDISGSTTAKGISCTSLSSSGNVGVSGNLTVSGIIYGKNNISLDRSSLYCPLGTATRDYLRFGKHILSSDSSYGMILTNTAGAWTTVRCGSVIANGTTLSSDKRLKTDIKYVNLDTQAIGENKLEAPNVNITTEDMHSFIETLPIASYRLKSDVKEGVDKTHYGFIAQDILYTKVGSELVEYDRIEIEPPVLDEEGNVLTEGVYQDEGLKYSENKFIAFICGALQEEIKQRKELEAKVLELEEKIK